jgi:NRPS condensation-like uncharacterized protein
MMKKMKFIGEKTFIKLNRQEFQCLVFENFFPSMGIITSMRFLTKHSETEIREAMRYLLSIYPKLRTFLESTTFGYRLKILKDDNKLDLLFDDVFDVVHNIPYDSEEYLTYRQELLNKPFFLENELPIRIRYFPDESMGILLFCIHHIILDGRSWHHMLNSLMSYLNGNKPSFVPLYSPNITSFLLEKPFYKVPFQILKSYQFFRNNMQNLENINVVTLSKKPCYKFGPVSFCQTELHHDITPLKSKLKESGYTMSVLILSAMTLTIDQVSGDDNKNKVISILVSVDLRPFLNEKQFIFGNYVEPIKIHVFHEHWSHSKKLLEEVKSQLDEKLNRLQRKEDIFRFLIVRLLSFLGRKNYARIIKIALNKKKGASSFTIQFSNLGNLDSMNSFGNKAQLYEAISIIPNVKPFFTVSSVNGRLTLNSTYPMAEFTHEEIKKFSCILRDKFQDLINLL